MLVNVVISHYKEEVEWVNNIKYPFIIYSNHSLEEGKFTNNGREANGYLKYIIDNYYNLPDYSIFVHGEQISYHHEGKLDELINNLLFNKKFFSINNRIELELIPPEKHWLVLKYIDVFETFLQKKLYVDKIQYYGNAQFYIHKDLILKNNIKKYIKLYEWKNNTTDITNWDVGLIFEYMWYEMFCK